jgi:hypothetical protein
LPGYNGTPIAGCQGKAVANITMGKITLEDNFVGKIIHYYLLFLVYTYIYMQLSFLQCS